MRRALLGAVLLAAPPWYAAPAAADPATYTSQAYAINEAGDIVGTISGPDFTGPVRWDRNGTITALATLPEVGNARPAVINAGGMVAGVLAGEFVIRWDARGRVTNLGGFQGAQFVSGINAGGVVVGSVLDGIDGDHAVRSTADGGLAWLPTVPGGFWATAADINDAGTVVGLSGNPQHAVRWDAASRITDLGTLPGGQFSGVADLNNAGIAVGDSTLYGTSAQHAVRWDAAGRITDLGTLPGGTWSTAARINDDGTVAGTGDDAAGRPHALRWDRTGALTDLGPLGSTRGAVVGLNSIGVVVAYGGDPGDLSARPLSWDPAGRLRPLPLPPGAVAGWPTGVNSAGSIPGMVRLADGTTRAVRWTGAGVGYLPVPGHRARPTR